MPNLSKSSVSFALTILSALFATIASGASAPRIIGGEPILMDKAPSIVALIDASRLASTGSLSQAVRCGGTVIAERWVLTAAHCVTNDETVMATDELRILANSHDLNNPSETTIAIRQIIVHEERNPATNSNDVALIELATATSAPATPISLVDPELNELTLVAGWGALQHTEAEGSFNFPSTLHAVEVSALPGEQCNTLPYYAGLIDETMICAGFPNGGKDHCHGDSGGPLYRYVTDGSLELAGVVSWAFGCGLEGRPGVYADVPHFQDWIMSRIDQPAEEPASDATQIADGDDAEVIQSDIPENDDTVAATTTQIPVLASGGSAGDSSSSGGSAGGLMLGVLSSFLWMRRKKSSIRHASIIHSVR